VSAWITPLCRTSGIQRATEDTIVESVPGPEKLEPGHRGPAPVVNLVETSVRSIRQSLPWQRVLLKQPAVPGFDWWHCEQTDALPVLVDR